MALRRKGRSAGRRAAVRWWLLSLAATAAAAALLAVALHVSASASSGAPYRLAKQPREAEELRWEQEFAPPQRASPHSRKLDGATDEAAGKRLWLPAPARRFVPCVSPSPEYKGPGASRGYLLVHTNGGLNQMRAGISDMVAVALKYIENTTYWKVKDIDPLEQRSDGHCPLTPKEVGMFLSALGYPSSTPVYIAAGEIYGGESHMVDLQSRFPILMNKEKLASAEELRPFSQYASQMAALDYIVSVESDVFIPSYSGNMARAVAGHRRFHGHRKTVIPDRKALVRLFDKVDSGLLDEGDTLSQRIAEMHRKRQGSPRKRKGPVSGTKGSDRFRSEEAFYENPLPDCFCQSKDDSTVSI